MENWLIAWCIIIRDNIQHGIKLAWFTANERENELQVNQMIEFTLQRAPHIKHNNNVCAIAGESERDNAFDSWGKQFIFLLSCAVVKRTLSTIPYQTKKSPIL